MYSWKWTAWGRDYLRMPSSRLKISIKSSAAWRSHHQRPYLLEFIDGVLCATLKWSTVLVTLEPFKMALISRAFSEGKSGSVWVLGGYFKFVSLLPHFYFSQTMYNIISSSLSAHGWHFQQSDDSVWVCASVSLCVCVCFEHVCLFSKTEYSSCNLFNLPTFIL